ncbi:PGF-CTERM sorting domain-containing protein [Halobacteriales archaeon QS_9_68_42]|nr:MAG: PGF-CTERM sorting domain-containing protein [Halobacteriales archaeon QS_9_68_42]
MRIRSAVLAAVLVVSLVGAAAAPAATQQAEGEAYSGTFVQFQTNTNAVADYAVDGSVVVESVTAQSASETDGGIGIGASSSTAIDGSGISSQNSAGARASVSFESGTDMEANDNQRGVITFTSTDGEQVVQANVSGNAQTEGDNRVVVTGDDGAQGTFILIGDGNVTTSEDGRVVAGVQEDSRLVYRQYNEERSEADETQERMIQNGTATAEAYVYGAAEAESDGDTATETESSTDDAEASGTSVVEYGQDTDVEIQERSRDRVNMTVERTESQGKVVIATVSESAVENAESLEVYVDGEAAAQADSYGEVQQATRNGDNSRYLVRQSSSAEAATDVVIGINQFSERQVSMQSADSTDGDSGTETEADSMDDSETETDAEDDGSSGDGAGFGVAAALVALAATLVAVRSRL